MVGKNTKIYVQKLDRIIHTFSTLYSPAIQYRYNNICVWCVVQWHLLITDIIYLLNCCETFCWMTKCHNFFSSISTLPAHFKWQFCSKQYLQYFIYRLYIILGYLGYEYSFDTLHWLQHFTCILWVFLNLTLNLHELFFLTWANHVTCS